MRAAFILSFFLISLPLPQAATAACNPPNLCQTANSIPSIAEQLGWITDTQQPCSGYYQPLSVSLNPQLGNQLKIEADQTSFQQGSTSTLQGHVTIQQQQRLLSATNVVLQQNASSGKLQSASLQGKVSIQEPGKLLITKQANVDFTQQTAELKQALYRLDITAAKQTLPAKKNLTAWGQAQLIQDEHPHRLKLQHTTYSTCAPKHPAWQLHADKIILNRDSGRGYARNASLTLKDVPVFYAPYFNFPIDDRRQSGLLFPTYSSSNVTGISLGLPYYWNIAPNYDATITPKFFTASGLQLNGQLRYLTDSSTGFFDAGLLPHDMVFAKFLQKAPSLYSSSPSLDTLTQASSTRSYLVWENKTQLNPHWSTNIAYNTVSDDYYLANFGKLPTTIIDNQLLRQADIRYQDTYWQFLGRLQSFQTLHPVNQAPVSNQYSSLPSLSLSGERFWQGLDLQLNSEFVHFVRQRNPDEAASPPTAERLMLQPGISWPKHSLAGYFTPELQLNSTYYTIGHPGNQYTPHISRTLPIADIDSGLYFDRNTRLAGKTYQQTLEPRLFYLYVPYRQQRGIPLFETALQPFNFDQLFSTNRFSGNDRLSDANQISLAVSSRLLDTNNGQEMLRASIGQAYYLQNRKVTLCATQNCQDVLTTVGSISANSHISPVVGQLNYSLNPAWNMLSEIAWDPHNRQTNNGSINFQYQPWNNHLINLGYNFVRYADIVNGLPATSSENNLNQATASIAWQLKEHWQALGSWNYNVSHQHPQTYLYGAQYDSCCWAVRLVAGRSFAALTPHNNPVFDHTIYLQLQLKGLGNMGSSELSRTLQNNIPGYSDHFG